MTQNTPKTSGDTLIEKLAHIEHERWSSWMIWMFDNWTEENIARWKQQMITPYEQLPEYSKESDRKEVRKTLDAIRQHEAQQEVLKYRGSCDAPGFDACVESEKKQTLEEITDAEMDDDDPIDDAYTNGYADGYKAKAISIRQEAAQGRAMSRPSVLFRPKLCKWEYNDGRGVYWTANYHEVEAKGYSPEDAMLAFDKEWLKSTKTEGQNP